MKRQVLLIIDDEVHNLKALRRLFSDEPYELLTTEKATEALEICRTRQVDLVLTDVRMPELDGLTLLRMLRENGVQSPVIVMTGYGSVDSAVAAMKAGACDYVTKPFDIVQIKKIVSDVMKRNWGRSQHVEQLKSESGFDGMIGTSKAMRNLQQQIRTVAVSESTVLIQGETGTGKELVARALHQLSRRAKKPFVAVNCSAIAASVFESELFGYIRGAFTGAIRDKVGMIKSAHSGTLFLDEVADMPLELQPKLLRVLEEREMIPVGATQSIPVDIRLVAATNQDLIEAVASGQFRKDLFYRLHVIPICVPPLRDRTEDIPVLVDHFFEHFRPSNKRITGFSQAVSDELQRYKWPGNVRELRNVVEHAMLLTPGGEIQLCHLPRFLAGNGTTKSQSEEFRHIPADLSRVERETILNVLQSTGGNKRRAAQMLGISRATLYRKLRLYNLPPGNAADEEESNNRG